MTENVIIGYRSESEHSGCVLIGPHLKSTKDNQLIIGNTEVSLSRLMTDDEFNILLYHLNQISLTKKAAQGITRMGITRIFKCPECGEVKMFDAGWPDARHGDICPRSRFIGWLRKPLKGE